MPNHKSAEKRDRQRETHRLRNRITIGNMRQAVKAAREAVDTKAENASALITKAVSLIDRAVTKGALKRNTASRYISRLTRRGSNAK